MSRGIFINTLNTYIGTALYEEFLGEKPEESEVALFGTYYEKDSSEKPLYVKKMMKRSKPGLFRKYMLEKIDTFIYDLHSGRLDDLEFGIKALTKSPLESEKTVIVISSVLAWGCTPPKMVEDIPEPQYDEAGNLIPLNPEENLENKIEINEEQVKKTEENEQKKKEELNNINIKEDDKIEENLNKSKNLETENVEKLVSNENLNIEDKEQEEAKKIQELEAQALKNKKKYKQVGYTEDEFPARVPLEVYKKIKEYEDKLLSLNFENLKIYIICAGIPYGGAETVFNYFFKSSWLQNPVNLPYFNEGNNYIPTIHQKDLAKIVKMVGDKKPEQKYIFAIDQTKNKTMKGIISSIARGIGLGKTKSVSKDEIEIKNISFTSQDFFIDPNKIDKTKLTQCITDNELTWQLHLNIDVLLANSKFIEEEWEWHCKEGIPGNIKKLLDEFSKMRKLRPIKIILNSSDKNQRCMYAEKLSKFYNIPVISYDTIMDKLNLDEDTLNEEEKLMNEKFLFLKKRLDGLNPNDPNEANDLLMNPTEIMFEALKYILKENICINRGYVLEGLPINLEEVNMLYNRKEEIKDEGEIIEDEKPAEDQPEDPEAESKPKEIKKKIKKKQYKTIFEKDLLPESVISLSPFDEKEIENVFWEVEYFFQENSVEVLDILIHSNQVEIFEMMRIYVDRNGRPFNYFIDTENDIQEKRLNYLKNKVSLAKEVTEFKKKEKQQIQEKLEMEYWDKMTKRIEAIKIDKAQIDQFDNFSTRKFLLLNIMPILTKGLLEVCKINPIDPIDYLADFLFKNSTD